LGPFGAPGCTLLVSDEDTGVLDNLGGSARWSLTLPDVPAAATHALFAQIVVLAPGANPLGFLTTNALELTIGY